MTLTEYINSYLGDLVTQLDVSASAISFIVAETLQDYQVDIAESDATDLVKLHKLANVETWKRMMVNNSASFDVSADGGSYKTSQIYDFCKQNYLNALTDASEYLTEYEIGIEQHSIHRHHHHDEYYSGSVCA